MDWMSQQGEQSFGLSVGKEISWKGRSQSLEDGIIETEIMDLVSKDRSSVTTEVCA